MPMLKCKYLANSIIYRSTTIAHLECGRLFQTNEIVGIKFVMRSYILTNPFGVLRTSTFRIEFPYMERASVNQIQPCTPELNTFLQINVTTLQECSHLCMQLFRKRQSPLKRRRNLYVHLLFPFVSTSLGPQSLCNAEILGQ